MRHGINLSEEQSNNLNSAASRTPTTLGEDRCASTIHQYTSQDVEILPMRYDPAPEQGK